MKYTISVKPSLDEFGFEHLLAQLSNIDISREIEIDLSDVEFIDPYGMVGVLEIGRFIFSSLKRKFTLYLPLLDAVVKYLERMDFFRLAVDFYILKPHTFSLEERYLRKRHSDVLLELTKIENSCDIHNIVTEVKRKAESILRLHLKYNEETIAGFIVALSEICQNIPEHSQDIGLVGIQKYFYGKKLNRNVVKIAVMDSGIGIKESLGTKFAITYDRRWADLIAVEKALFEGASRYEELGRGHGLNKVKEFVEKWGGRISIRSQTAKVMVLPEWNRGNPRQSSLSFFPGTQINIVLPEILS